jgi:hypothetical protein
LEADNFVLREGEGQIVNSEIVALAIQEQPFIIFNLDLNKAVEGIEGAGRLVIQTSFSQIPKLQPQSMKQLYLLV